MVSNFIPCLLTIQLQVVFKLSKQLRLLWLGTEIVKILYKRRWKHSAKAGGEGGREGDCLVSLNILNMRTLHTCSFSPPPPLYPLRYALLIVIMAGVDNAKSGLFLK